MNGNFLFLASSFDKVSNYCTTTSWSMCLFLHRYWRQYSHYLKTIHVQPKVLFNKYTWYVDVKDLPIFFF